MRAPRAGDERGSLSMFLLVSLVGLMLGAVLVPMVIGSVRSTRFASTRVQSIDVAQAGIDVVLGKIRASTDSSSGLGDSAQLPCAPSGAPITGTVQGASYSVTVSYFTVDPDKNSTASAMLCVTGYGTYDTASGSATPSYARITSTGTPASTTLGATKGRTLVSTYVLQTSNTNISGGTIGVANGTTASYCMDAGSATPAVATILVIQTCSTTTPPASQQTFAYRTDLTLELVSSETTAQPTGLCLDTVAPPASGSTVVLKACAADGVAPTYTQQWSYNDNGQYQASTSTSSTTGTLAGLCMNVGAQSANQQVTLGSCGTSWIPSASVGAGAAVEPQWVNNKQFGRCLDVNGANTSATHLISYPCKQNPYAAAVKWNQRFVAPTATSGATSATGLFYSTVSGVKWCMYSPLTLGGYPVVKVCDSTSPNQQWTVYRGSTSLPYAKRYTLVDNAGNCLGLADPFSGEAWSALAVQTCTGESGQKWNAPGNLAASSLQNTREQ